MPNPEPPSENGPDREEGYDRALGLLRKCASPNGFLASPSEKTNYRRVWGRDGAILSLASLLTDDEELIATGKRTLLTLVEYQGPRGEIPSNVDTASGRISYGGTAGRVDADLWFLIACGEYWKALGDEDFLNQLHPAIEKVRFLLGAWEFNNRGLIYIPPTGDWADEYLQNGYVLYDQLLYLQAQRNLGAIHSHLHDSEDHALEERTSRLWHLIRANYWFEPAGDPPEDVYHEILYEKGRAAAEHCAGKHWLPYFSPVGYGYRFDSFAHVLVSLFDVASDERRDIVDQFVADEILPEKFPLLPAFSPVIEPVDEDWEDLRMTFSHTFKNRPYEYHNGGLWPMITGFHVADLARRGKTEEAERCLDAIHRANAMEMDGEPWGFPEFIHGKKFTPGGTRHQGWSAAAAIIGHHALQGRKVFTIHAND